jgi:predicted nucleic acid-binding protein
VHAAQSHLLNAVAAGSIQVMDLLPEDDARIAELNDRDADLPGDFADPILLILSDLLERVAGSC